MTEYPASRKFAEDGATVAGNYIETTEATTDYGNAPILVLEVDGEPRSVWVTHAALRNRIADELAKRPAGDFDTGETITVAQLGKRTGASGREYMAYDVAFGNARKRSAAEIFGAPADTAPSATVPADADPIPF
jgi:hypothetical protein